MRLSYKEQYLWIYSFYIFSCVCAESLIANNSAMEMSLRLIRYSCMIFLLLMCMNNKKTRYKIKTTVMLSIVIIAALLNTFFFMDGMENKSKGG